MANRPAWKNNIYGALLAGVLGAVSAPASAADPILSLTASANPAVQGSMIDLNVMISDVSDLFAYQFTLSFNAAVLQAASVTEGGFLASGGGSTFGDGGSIDNALGSIALVFNTRQGGVPGVSGNGSLAHITFKVMTVGNSVMSFSDAIFLNSNLADVTVTAQPFTLQTQAVPEPSTYLLFAAGLAGLAGLTAMRRRRAVAP